VTVNWCHEFTVNFAIKTVCHDCCSVALCILPLKVMKSTLLSHLPSPHFSKTNLFPATVVLWL